MQPQNQQQYSQPQQQYVPQQGAAIAANNVSSQQNIPPPTQPQQQVYTQSYPQQQQAAAAAGYQYNTQYTVPSQAQPQQNPVQMSGANAATTAANPFPQHQQYYYSQTQATTQSQGTQQSQQFVTQPQQQQTVTTQVPVQAAAGYSTQYYAAGAAPNNNNNNVPPPTEYVTTYVYEDANVNVNVNHNNAAAAGGMQVPYQPSSGNIAGRPTPQSRSSKADDSTTLIILYLFLAVSFIFGIVCVACVSSGLSEMWVEFEYGYYDVDEQFGWLESSDVLDYDEENDYSELDDLHDSNLEGYGRFFGAMNIITCILYVCLICVTFKITKNTQTKYERNYLHIWLDNWCNSCNIEPKLFILIISVALLVMTLISVILWQSEFDSFCEDRINLYEEYYDYYYYYDLTDSECSTLFGAVICYLNVVSGLISVGLFTRILPNRDEIVTVDGKNANVAQNEEVVYVTEAQPLQANEMAAAQNVMMVPADQEGPPVVTPVNANPLSYSVPVSQPQQSQPQVQQMQSIPQQ